MFIYIYFTFLPGEQKNQRKSQQKRGKILFSLVITELKIKTLRFCFSPRKIIAIFVIGNTPQYK